jgi:hypothetical protein
MLSMSDASFPFGIAKADFLNSSSSNYASFTKGELVRIKFRGEMKQWSMVRS